MRPELPASLLLAALLAVVPAHAAPDEDTDAPPPEEGSEPVPDEDSEEDAPPVRIPDPAEAARRAPPATPSPRPRGVPDDWTEVPLEPEGLDEDDGADVVVWGTAAVRAARRALIGAFEEEGWEVRRTKANGDVIFKAPEGWMGAARLSPDGLITFRRRLLSWEPVEPVAGPPEDGFGALDPDYRGTAGSTRGGIQGPASLRKVEPRRQDLLRATNDELRRYRAVLAETALRQSLAALPDRLDALWNGGQSLTGGPPLATPEERRVAVLQYWVTRPDTREGRLALETIEDWIASVMQRSEHPASAEELDAAAARRGDGRHPLGR